MLGQVYLINHSYPIHTLIFLFLILGGAFEAEVVEQRRRRRYISKLKTTLIIVFTRRVTGLWVIDST